MLGFPDGSDGKKSAFNVGDLGWIPGLGRSSGGGNDNLTQYSYLENPHGQRSLVDYSPWGHKESDKSKQMGHKLESFCIAKGNLKQNKEKIYGLSENICK